MKALRQTDNKNTAVLIMSGGTIIVLSYLVTAVEIGRTTLRSPHTKNRNPVYYSCDRRQFRGICDVSFAALTSYNSKFTANEMI